MKCNVCNQPYSPRCDYRQGRCPHHPAMIENILDNNHKARFYNLYHALKDMFRKIFKK